MTTNSIAVLGHRSWVGQTVVPALAATGCRLKVIARAGSEAGSVPDGVEVVTLDWADTDAFVQALGGVDIVLSLVGQPGLASQSILPPILARAGVGLFISSDFTFQHDYPEAAEIPVIKNKAVLERALYEAGVPYTRIWQGNFAEFALGTPRAGVDIPNDRILLVGDMAAQRLNICTLGYVAAALAALLPHTSVPELAGRTIGLTELTPTASDIEDAMQRKSGREVAIAREPESAALERIAARHPLALMDLVKVLWSRGLHSVGDDVFEPPLYAKATLDDLIVHGKLGGYREVAVPYTLDAYFE